MDSTVIPQLKVDAEDHQVEVYLSIRLSESDDKNFSAGPKLSVRCANSPTSLSDDSLTLQGNRTDFFTQIKDAQPF